MTQIGEMVGIALMRDQLEECPFKLESPENPSIEKENVAKDDLQSAVRRQNNDGGTLGKNLIKGSPDGWGAPGTINKLYQPPDMRPQPRRDSKTDPSLKVTVQGKKYPFKVAAHHLIPGEAALAKSELHKCYMVKDGEVTTPKGKKLKILANIGYNVNGNHNGVWLPGNYGIRGSTSPKKGHSWRKIVEDPEYKDWCFEYMLACVKEAKGQFHDAHTVYSEAVLDALNKIHVLMSAHQDTDCPDCKDKTEIYPPYKLKSRLYLFSRYLRNKLRMQPGKWKVPWFTSDRFKQAMMENQLLSE